MAWAKRRCAGLVGALAIAALCACDHDSTPAALPFTRALLAVDGSADPAASLAKLAFVTDRVRAALHDKPSQPQGAIINRVIFDTLGFVREVDDQDPRFMLLTSVLNTRRGSCLGLGSLYLALGESLGLDIRGVLVPGHFFVRTVDPRGAHNIELLRRGEQMPDAWYREKYAVPAVGTTAYLRGLSRDEVLGVIQYNLGNHARIGGQLTEARTAYARACAAFPGFAEAHASLGLVHHLLGDSAAARQQYEAARRANPALSGLDHNLELLDAEPRMPGVTSPSEIR